MASAHCEGEPATTGAGANPAPVHHFPGLESRQMQYLYNEGDLFYFENWFIDDIAVTAHLKGDFVGTRGSRISCAQWIADIMSSAHAFR